MPMNEGRKPLSDSRGELQEERPKARVKSPVSISMKRSSAPELTTRMAWAEPEVADSRGRRFRSDGDADERKCRFGRRVVFRSDPGGLPGLTSKSTEVEENGPRHLRSSRKTREVLVPTEQQVCELFTSDDTDEDSGSSFAGPLGQIYPNGRIRRRRRHDEDEWQKCMQANENWHASAENSGEAADSYSPSHHACCIMFPFSFCVVVLHGKFYSYFSDE